ncbi:Pyridoxal phosphate phosphatase-related [Trema orientale]|uniref:Pyridoxal phosphate phosphatase-related n=1 Tax=Trema orientale TaxID=63057 RepID=A0A2P5FE84_TREOI|nr:Pyridoxal phosphate phosphatase-related [Trema orientale]
MAGKTVVVFYFDKTIIEYDSVNWVVDELGATDLFNQLRLTMPWNSLMDRMMKELHERGKTIQEIAEVLKRTPIDPRIVPAIKAAYDLGCDLRIVSYANLFFVETILNHLELRDYFSEINTKSYSFVNEQGRLRILPFHDFSKSSHGCTRPLPSKHVQGCIHRKNPSFCGCRGKQEYFFKLCQNAKSEAEIQELFGVFLHTLFPVMMITM